jgi:hypothetical protein
MAREFARRATDAIALLPESEGKRSLDDVACYILERRS